MNKVCTQAEDLACPVGPDRLPGARLLRNAVQGQGDELKAKKIDYRGTADPVQ